MSNYPKLLTLTIQDAGGQKSPVSIHIGDSNLGGVEDEDSFLNDYLLVFWDAIKPLITGVLVSARVSVEYPLTAFSNNTPSALSDIEEKVMFKLAPCDLSERLVNFSLPTVKESLFLNSGASDELDFTNSDVIAFVHIMTNNIGDGGIDARDSHGNEICNIERGISIFKG